MCGGAPGSAAPVRGGGLDEWTWTAARAARRPPCGAWRLCAPHLCLCYLGNACAQGTAAHVEIERGERVAIEHSRQRDGVLQLGQGRECPPQVWAAVTRRLVELALPPIRSRGAALV